MSEKARDSLFFMFNGEPTEICFEKYTTTVISQLGFNDDNNAVVTVVPYTDEDIAKIKKQKKDDKVLLDYMRTFHPDIASRLTVHPVKNRRAIISNSNFQSVVRIPGGAIYGRLEAIPVVSVGQTTDLTVMSSYFLS